MLDNSERDVYQMRRGSQYSSMTCLVYTAPLHTSRAVGGLDGFGGAMMARLSWRGGTSWVSWNAIVVVERKEDVMIEGPWMFVFNGT